MLELLCCHATTNSRNIEYTQYDQAHIECIIQQSPTSPVGFFGKNFFTRDELETRPSSRKKFNYFVIDDQVLKIEIQKSNTVRVEQSRQEISSAEITFIDCLNPIRERLSLSITQLAELFDVTRKSIYDWYEGIEPRSATVTRIEILRQALDAIPSEVDLKRLKAVWNIPVSGQSFRAVYHNDKLDSGSLLTELTKKLNELSPSLVKKTSSPRKATDKLGTSHLTDLDKHADFS